MVTPSTANPVAIADEVRRVAERVLEREVAGDPTLEELELDSLQRLTLAVALEDRFRVILSDVDAEKVRRLSDLARLIAERGGAT
jgi:acyl carrier protein